MSVRWIIAVQVWDGGGDKDGVGEAGEVAREEGGEGREGIRGKRGGGWGEGQDGVLLRAACTSCFVCAGRMTICACEIRGAHTGVGRQRTIRMHTLCLVPQGECPPPSLPLQHTRRTPRNM
jgi:hypothetical protein